MNNLMVHFRKGYDDASAILLESNSPTIIFNEFEILDQEANTPEAIAYANGYAHALTDWTIAQTNVLNRPVPHNGYDLYYDYVSHRVKH